MAYYRGKDIEKSRGNAMKELILEKRNVAQIARRYGKNRSTIYRWKKKWENQQTVLLENAGRPSRPPRSSISLSKRKVGYTNYQLGSQDSS